LQVSGFFHFGIGGFPDANKSSSTDGKKSPSPDLQKLNFDYYHTVNKEYLKCKIVTAKPGNLEDTKEITITHNIPPSSWVWQPHKK